MIKMPKPHSYNTTDFTSAKARSTSVFSWLSQLYSFWSNKKKFEFYTHKISLLDFLTKHINLEM